MRVMVFVTVDADTCWLITVRAVHHHVAYVKWSFLLNNPTLSDPRTSPLVPLHDIYALDNYLVVSRHGPVDFASLAFILTRDNYDLIACSNLHSLDLQLPNHMGTSDNYIVRCPYPAN